jgi:hypothetical protein
VTLVPHWRVLVLVEFHFLDLVRDILREVNFFGIDRSYFSSRTKGRKNR